MWFDGCAGGGLMVGLDGLGGLSSLSDSVGWHGGDGLMAELDDLRGLFQP